jgi:hypothetical protein
MEDIKIYREKLLNLYANSKKNLSDIEKIGFIWGDIDKPKSDKFKSDTVNINDELPETEIKNILKNPIK